MRRANTPELVFARREVSESGCWLYTGYLVPGGYGYVSISGVPDYIHRHAYRAFKGEIPARRDLDHICRVRHCFNPDHLEPVTRSENVARGIRGFALTGKCRSGRHDMTNADDVKIETSGHRRCRPCATERVRLKRWRERGWMTDETVASAGCA